MEFIGIGVVVLLVMLGVPLFLAIFVGVIATLIFALGMDPSLILVVMFDKVNSLILIAIPLFILSGQLLHQGGATKRLSELLNSLMGHLPGGPAYAVVVTCVVFAAMTSSSTAAVAGLAPVVVPLLVSLGYSKKFAIGLILASGSMTPIIPPSISLIVYGYISETSVLTLWTAAIVPGLLQATLIMITVWFHGRRGHYHKLPSVSWADRWRAVKRGWPVMAMPAVILGPLYGGIATPTEVASIAVFYSLFLGVFVFRELKFKQFWEACRFTVFITTAILAIIMAAFMLNIALVYIRLPFQISDWLASLGLSWAAFMAVMFFAYLLMGAFLDTTAILLVSVPILLPTILNLNISPIMYGVFTVNCTEIAVLTPPYGILLFAATGILKERYDVVVKSMLLFYPALIIHPILIAYIPQMSLWFPHFIGR
ncbi:TRAP transporter large permease [Chloroflexota bacterium]